MVAARGRLPQAPEGRPPHAEPRDSLGRRPRGSELMRGPGRIARGLLTDPDRPVAFRFDGRRMQGLEGDTLASALLANGKRLIARSFKYHRPRGIVTAGPEGAWGVVDGIEAGGRDANRARTR